MHFSRQNDTAIALLARTRAYSRTTTSFFVFELRRNMAPRPRQKPAVAGSGWSWNRVENFDPAAFKSVDGAKIFRTMYSYGANSNRMVLHWGVGPLLNKSQKALVADIQNQRDISLEVEFSKECQQQGVTQVPYREFTVNYSICKFGIPFD